MLSGCDSRTKGGASSSDRSHLDRRWFVLGLSASFGTLAGPPKANAQTRISLVQAAIAEAEQSVELSSPSYALREYAENFPALQLERAPSGITPSDLPISDTSKQLITAFEVSSEAIYKQKYQRPTWPGGMSGVTIGIGYDIGYVKAGELRSDWSGVLEESQIESLTVACGRTNISAKELISELSSVSVSWENATQEFQQELKKYVALTQKGLPNFTALSEGCRGSLVSLVYNRGPAFDAPGNRYAEMRNIHQHMLLKHFDKIPGEIRAMERLWPDVKGLIKRREAEANLFEAGLGS
jgi:GH24 family phage-related lysozyme (muramidase)